jgi:hypothetical protein
VLSEDAMTKRSALCFITILWAAVPAWATSLPDSPKPPAGARTAIFVSDLHLGVGRDPVDTSPHPAWHNLEDFRWGQEFSDFLTRINQDEKSKVDFVILGDFLELWQSLSDKDCHHEDLEKGKDLGCTEAEAKIRAARVLDEHPDVLKTLAWFSRQGDNRVTIVPGNHDAALMFPCVRKLLLERIEAPADRLRIATEGYWWSADGKVLAEHGHQIGKDPNRFEGWPENPFAVRNGITYLQQPWGEQMVQEVFNKREKIYATVDNLSEELLGIRYILKSQTTLEKLSSVGDLVRFAILQTSWKQSLGGLSTGDAKDNMDPAHYFDLDRLRKDYEAKPERFVFDFIAPDDPLRALLEDARKAGEPTPKIGDLTQEEIRAVCAQRLVENESRPADALLPVCPTTAGLSAAAQALNEALLPGAKNQRFQDYLVQLRGSLPAGSRPTRQIEHYVFAHTHKEEQFLPFSLSDTFKPAVWNDGAWQRRATPEQLCTVIKRKKYSESEALLKLQPEDLPACYPFIRAQWTQAGESPKLKLLYWVQEQGKPGSLRSGCDFVPDPECLPKKPKKKANG